ncbi:hypothetical protein VTN77DRAFT_6312 [Rasamsonia byssochlamydoides]|uniref:uncharacterized protein n=1 Tax=Rasamsonia byssochlamydoides TaxID=89139 RepID=UPI0037449BDD
MEQSQEEIPNNERPGTPPRPPYSPVTPVFAHLETVSGAASIVPPGPELSPTTVQPTQGGIPGPFSGSVPQQQPATFAPEPAPVPISESDNPDVIALRSAISILQLQKQRSLQDIRTLDRLKKAAAADPEKFAQELVAGRLTSEDPSDLVDLLPPGENNDNVDSSQTGERASAFDKIPKPQNVVRMPPINWAKYHIVGEPLDRMHEEQRQRPSPGEPRRDDLAQRAPEHVLAAPYRPLTDKLDSPAKGRGTKKEKKT